MVMRLVAMTYQAGAKGLPVALINQATTYCVEPPKIDTPSA